MSSTLWVFSIALCSAHVPSLRCFCSITVKEQKHPIGRIMREYAWIWRLQYLVLQGLVMMCNLRESLIHVISLCLCVSNRIHLLLLAFKESVVEVGSGWHRCFWLRIRLLTPWVLQWKHARSVVSLLFGLEVTIFYDFERYPSGGLMWCSQHLYKLYLWRFFNLPVMLMGFWL